MKRRSAATGARTSARCPEQIIQGLKRGETNDPVMMLDEVDKLGRDFRGDPYRRSWKFLIQSRTIRSAITTLMCRSIFPRYCSSPRPNWMDPIPEPLRDRMEIIELPGYTARRNCNIAHKYLIPKQATEHGLKVGEQNRIHGRGSAGNHPQLHAGSGVRNLEREIATITGNRRGASPKAKRTRCVTRKSFANFLGVPKFRTRRKSRSASSGPALQWGWSGRRGRRHHLHRGYADARRQNSSP